MEGGFGWQFGGQGYNDWDLYAVVRRGCGAPPPPPYCYDPFYALPPAPQAPNLWQQHAMDVLAGAEPAANMWQQQPDMDVPVVFDEDFLAHIFFPVAQPPPPAAAPSTNEVVVPPQGAAGNDSPPPAAVKRGSSDAGGSSSKQIKRGRQKACSKRGRQQAEVTAVMTVPSGNLPSADPWSWRKYGQKEIKTNLKERSYFRCAAADACPAKRQVEKCAANDDELVIITYTGDHTHAVPLTKNPHAGTTRHNRRRVEAPPTRRPKPNAEVLAGGPSHQAPPPVPVPAPVVNPPAPVRSNLFEAEEDDDAIALKLLIDDAVSAPENAFLFRAPQLAPVVNNSYATVWDFASGKAEHVTYLQ